MPSSESPEQHFAELLSALLVRSTRITVKIGGFIVLLFTGTEFTAINYSSASFKMQIGALLVQ